MVQHATWLKVRTVFMQSKIRKSPSFLYEHFPQTRHRVPYAATARWGDAFFSSFSSAGPDNKVSALKWPQATWLN
jgi:hypothetical protein